MSYSYISMHNYEIHFCSRHCTDIHFCSSEIEYLAMSSELMHSHVILTLLKHIVHCPCIFLPSDTTAVILFSTVQFVCISFQGGASFFRNPNINYVRLDMARAREYTTESTASDIIPAS